MVTERRETNELSPEIAPDYYLEKFFTMVIKETVRKRQVASQSLKHGHRRAGNQEWLRSQSMVRTAPHRENSEDLQIKCLVEH